jgi:hypothetical protein
LSGIFKIKFLWIGLFLAFPPMAAWALRGGHDKPAPSPVAMTEVVETNRIKMPVEVVTKGGKTEWVMVDVPTQAIPEPGTTTLLMTLSCILLLRRKREE